MQHSISALKIAATLLVILMATPKIHSMETQLVPYFDTLPDELIQNVAYNIKYPEDIGSFGCSHKRAGSFLRNYDFVHSLVEKRTLLPYRVEDTHFYRAANNSFRDLIANTASLSSADQIAALETMYNSYGGSEKQNLINLNTCGKEKHDDYCRIPLVQACIQHNRPLVKFLLSKGGNATLNPRKVCTTYAYTSLIDATFNENDLIPLFPRTKIVGTLVKNGNGTVIIPENILHSAMWVIRKCPDNKNDYKGIKTLIKYGAPVNGLSNTSSKVPPLSTLLTTFDLLKEKMTEQSLANIMTLLLDAGANETLQDSRGNSGHSYTNSQSRTVFNSVVQKHAEFVKKHTPNK